MTSVANIEMQQFKNLVLALAMEGKYGKAIEIINDAISKKAFFMASDDEDWLSFIKGWICGTQIIDCCDNGLCGVYCLGFMACFFCCGEDTASTCCGCNFLSKSCSDGVRSGCGN